MSDTLQMRRLLSDQRRRATSLSPEERDVLVKGHAEAMNSEAARELQAFHTTLQQILPAVGSSKHERTARMVLRALGSLRRQPSMPRPSHEHIVTALEECQTLDAPAFTLQSAQQVAHNPTGDVIRFTRANASARTLEVAAATGEFGGVRWPSSESFIVGFNRSQASIGGLLNIPAHGDGAVLTVSVQLRVEQLVPGGSSVAATASSLLSTFHGNDDDLPLRGTAVGWCRSGLSLHGPQGSARAAVEFVSAWSTLDGEESHDRAPGGLIDLTTTAILGSGTSVLSVFVDATCFAGAEESEDQFVSGFSVFDCRDKPVGDLIGVYTQPSRLRIRQVTARLCELPVLLEHTTVSP